MEERKSLTEQYVILFDRLPPLLETMDYENGFYQGLMFDAIMNEEPITEEIIEKALEEQKIIYDTSEDFENKKSVFKNFKKGK